jgi:hypothetical protein
MAYSLNVSAFLQPTTISQQRFFHSQLLKEEVRNEPYNGSCLLAK